MSTVFFIFFIKYDESDRFISIVFRKYICYNKSGQFINSFEYGENMLRIRKGINQDTIQEWNRSLLLKELRKKGICSRAHLAKLSELKQATVTNIMKDFIDWELVAETGLLSGNKGRRSIGLTINREKYRVFGLQISRKFYKIGVFDLAGHQLDTVIKDIPKHPDVSSVLRNMCTVIHDFEKTYAGYSFLALGVALPGPFISSKNRIALLVGGEEWAGINIKEDLEKELDFPVFLEHDANAGAFTHMWRLKDAYQHQVLVYISVGPGIGAGIIMDNKIYTGALGIAGEIGHTSIDVNGRHCSCGNRGCLDLYASTTALAEAVNAAYGRKGDGQLTLQDIRQMLQKKDEICLEHFTDVCRYIGYCIVNMINTINPDIIIIGDEISNMLPDLTQEIIHAVVKERILPELHDSISITVSRDEDNVILTGAAIVAINAIFENPETYMPKHRTDASGIHP